MRRAYLNNVEMHAISTTCIRKMRSRLQLRQSRSVSWDRVRLKLNERQESAENCCDHFRVPGGAFGQMLNRSSHSMFAQIIRARLTETYIQQRSELESRETTMAERFIGVTKISMPETVIEDIHPNITAFMPTLITVCRADNSRPWLGRLFSSRRRPSFS
jgi:hypothetical protein